MQIDLVNQYYDKLYLSSVEYKELKNIKKKKEIIISSLNKVINSNNDYLLNDSLLNYLSSLDTIVYELNVLSSNSINLKIESLTHYYRSIIFDILNNVDSTYLKVLDTDTKFACNYAAIIIRIINSDVHKHYMGNKLLLKKLVYVLLCYCHINNRMNEFSKIYQDLFNKLDMIIEDMKLNNINDRDDFTVRTVILLENNDKKKIL